MWVLIQYWWMVKRKLVGDVDYDAVFSKVSRNYACIAGGVVNDYCLSYAEYA